MKFVICNQKGGSGKTTATMLLAYALGAAGQSVGIVDRDPQRTATLWLEQAPGPGVELAREGAEYDVLFLDIPAALANPATRASILEADRVVLVSSTAPVDMWSTADAAALVRELRPDLRPVLLFSRLRSNTAFGRARADFARALGLRALKNAIPDLQCIQRAQVDGYKALPPAQRENISNLAIELLSLRK